MKPLFKHVPDFEARLALMSLTAGVVLTAVKFGAYFLTNSAAVFSDALESVVNVLAATMALYSLWVAHRPADAEHPYGHGKIEFLSAGSEGGMIVIAGVVAGVHAIDELIFGPGLQAGRLNLGLALLGVALVVNGALGGALVRAGRRSGSATLVADGHHLLSDAVTSIAALFGLLIVRLTGRLWVDPVAALLVAGYIVGVGIRLMQNAAGGLMDRQDVDDQRLLRGILDAHLGPAGKEPQICSYHKLRHRHSGRYHWVDFHLVVPGHWDIDHGHRVASRIEHEIELALEEGNATAHVEPCTDAECPLCSHVRLTEAGRESEASV